MLDDGSEEYIRDGREQVLDAEVWNDNRDLLDRDAVADDGLLHRVKRCWGRSAGRVERVFGVGGVAWEGERRDEPYQSRLAFFMGEDRRLPKNTSACKRFASLRVGYI